MKDNFSQQAAAYAQCRPQYPQELFDYILSFVQHPSVAWDCGTGNGQTAGVLSKYFEKVYATDISVQQLQHGVKAPNIMYSVQPAENTNLPDSSIDLITVSQAIHWFQFDAFYAEVNRVAKPGAVIAVWTYSLLHISEEIDAIIQHYHFNTLADYWDTERKYVDDAYRTIPFPFKETKTPAFQITQHWSLQQLSGYLHTWSALQKYMQHNTNNPAITVMNQIATLWGNAEKREIHFPIHLRLGTIK